MWFRHFIEITQLFQYFAGKRPILATPAAGGAATAHKANG
jgi:hypothetical protein